MNLDVQHFKDLLLKEKALLEKELEPIADSKATGEWEAEPVPAVDTADREDVATSIEDYMEKNETVRVLETQLNEVLNALRKIEDGTFGICEVSGEAIETDRLEANPSARTCKAHMN
ncbi:MAG TPA: TraR/DksA C4-type zinc finger protein [Candidatus Paceibacterota bacterium]